MEEEIAVIIPSKQPHTCRFRDSHWCQMDWSNA